MAEETIARTGTSAGRRPIAVWLASLLALLTAVCAVLMGLRLLPQVAPFVARAGAVDPGGPDTDEYTNQSSVGIHLIAWSFFFLALVCVVCALAMLRPVQWHTGAIVRWITLLVVVPASAAYPAYIALKGGIGFTIVAIPHEYNGDNAVHLTLPQSFQHQAVHFNAAIAVLLLATLVLLVLPVTSRYFRKQRVEPLTEDFVSYLHHPAQED